MKYQLSFDVFDVLPPPPTIETAVKLSGLLDLCLSEF